MNLKLNQVIRIWVESDHYGPQIAYIFTLFESILQVIGFWLRDVLS